MPNPSELERLSEPAPELVERQCSVCKGAGAIDIYDEEVGQMDDWPCTNCGGSGKVYVPKEQSS